MTYDTDHWEALARFTNLPAQNDDFGQKTCELNITQNVRILWIQRLIEVFFDRNATNHPGGGSPNWYYYWGQVYANPNMAYDASCTDDAWVPAMYFWSYTTSQSKSAILIGPSSLGEGQDYGVGTYYTGIDWFVEIVVHEEKHIDQISRADSMVPVAAGTSFRYGWSWNQGTHNHWTKGADGQWGVAKDPNIDPHPAADDDSNGTYDDAAPVPPFEPGHGDDVDLTHATHPDWPASWTLPSPGHGIDPIEAEAVNWANSRVSEDQYRTSDWGKPGKQHSTTAWDD